MTRPTSDPSDTSSSLKVFDLRLGGFNGVGGGDSAAVDNLAVQCAVGFVAVFQQHLLLRQPQLVADQPHPETLGFAVRAQSVGQPGHQWVLFHGHGQLIGATGPKSAGPANSMPMIPTPELVSVSNRIAVACNPVAENAARAMGVAWVCGGEAMARSRTRPQALDLTCPGCSARETIATNTSQSAMRRRISCHQVWASQREYPPFDSPSDSRSRSSFRRRRACSRGRRR